MLLAATLLALAAIQAPAASEASEAEPGNRFAAVWDGGEITFERFDRFLGATVRGKPTGIEALDHILQIRIVEHEASERGMRADAERLEALLQEARAAIEAQGLDYEQALAERGLTEESFRELLAAALLHERLVLADREDGSTEKPDQEELLEWSQDRIRELKERSEPAPPGVVFKAGNFTVSEADLGATARAALGPSRLEAHLRQLVFMDSISAWAREEGVALTDEFLQAEIDWRRTQVAENPAYQGATYEGLLQAEGSSIEAVKQGDELKSAGLLRLYAERRFDDAWFEALPPQERASFERRFGVARLLAWILLRAEDDHPDPLVPSFDEAAAELRGYAAETADAEAFFELAERISEHEPSRRRRGMLGWVHREEPGAVDPQVCAAAFNAPVREVSGPHPTREGQCLLFVLEERPAPGEAEFRDLVRRSLHLELKDELLADIGLQTVYSAGG